MAICNFCDRNFNLFGVCDNGYSFCPARCRDNARAAPRLQSLLKPNLAREIAAQAATGAAAAS